jgi:hypothetical protein
MAAIVLMALLVPVVVWIAVRLETSLDQRDSAATVADQPSSGESDETLVPVQAARRLENPRADGLKPGQQAPPGRGIDDLALQYGHDRG